METADEPPEFRVCRREDRRVIDQHCIPSGFRFMPLSREGLGILMGFGRDT